MKAINIECVNITLNITHGAHIGNGASPGGFDSFITNTLEELEKQALAVHAADAARDAEQAGCTATDVDVPAPPREPAFDIDESEEGTPEDAAVVEEDVADDAYGEGGTNAAKLAWAMARVVDNDDGALVKLSEIEENGGYTAVVERNSPEARNYANLYRERDGYAKLGSARFGSAHSASGAASGANHIAVVGLTSSRTK